MVRLRAWGLLSDWAVGSSAERTSIGADVANSMPPMRVRQPARAAQSVVAIDYCHITRSWFHLLHGRCGFRQQHLIVLIRCSALTIRDAAAGSVEDLRLLDTPETDPGLTCNFVSRALGAI